MQSSLIFFLLGFLSAGLIALIVAPMAWRRAVALTRRRIEASVPLTLAEIEADKDRMRAEFAMATRRLEINFKNFREKSAAQIVEINRNREELKRLMAERTERHEVLSRMEAQSGEIRAELRKREDELQILVAKLDEAEVLLEQRVAEIEKLGRMYDEASFNASNRQVEIAARESEIEKLNNEMATLRDQRRAAERQSQETIAESTAVREALKAEQERASALEARIERLLATIADRDEKIDRSEREIGKMREAMKATSTSEGGLQSQIAELRADKVRLENEKKDLTEQLASFTSGAKSKEMERLVAKITADRELLEERVRVLTRENRKLKVDVAVHERTKSDEWSGEKKESARLREQMTELAAEVIRLTAALEGPDSPIDKALGSGGEEHSDGGRKMSSLAEKVRALQKAAG